jgi:putative resolvase
MIWVQTARPKVLGRMVVDARVSSPGQCAGLDGQVARLTCWAAWNGHEVGEVVTRVGSGLGGRRSRLRWVLSDPTARVVVVEPRDRLARLGAGHLQAVLGARGRQVVVADPGESTDDLVQDMIGVLTWMCAALDGRCGGQNRAMGAVTATKLEPGEAAL